MPLRVAKTPGALIVSYQYPDACLTRRRSIRAQGAKWIMTTPSIVHYKSDQPPESGRTRVKSKGGK
ncbi:uncharacterized protein TrAtP1_006310 [Trichoderma atroviride]|uniref:uncharacterized protein n=1 Tax=Hypocrea atroviridis TaxID=63577 RepID=UPI0033327CEE|nr:hypothetical protein TrAtP1_006310 [Trichoderma atroviride]